MVKVEDLKCGDCFTFQRTRWVCLLNFTDKRHTQTVLTCINEKLYKSPSGHGDPCKIVAMRLVRTFEVEVHIRYPIELQVLENTQEEVKGLPAPEIGDKW